MLPREAVVMGYRLFLGREPENEEVIIVKMGYPSIGDLITDILGSAEFRSRYSFVRVGSNSWVWVDTAFGFRLRVNLQDTSIGWPILEGRYENEIIEFVKNQLHLGDVAVDIGANIGLFANLMASVVGSGGKVYAFEPLPHLFESLSLSIKENGYEKIVTAHQVALSSETGEAKIIFAENTTNFGGAYLDFDGHVPAGHVALPVIIGPLWQFCPEKRISFIKMDVEGGEYLVMQPMVDILSEMKTTILSEIHPHQLRLVSRKSPTEYIAMMASFGYRCRPIDETGRAGEIIQSYDREPLINVLFAQDSTD